VSSMTRTAPWSRPTARLPASVSCQHLRAGTLQRPPTHRHRPGSPPDSAPSWEHTSSTRQPSSGPVMRRACWSLSEGYTKRDWASILDRPRARSGGEGRARVGEWPPVVRDVRDPDDDCHHIATSWPQVRPGRRRGPCSGARLPTVGMSSLVTRPHGDDHQDDAEPEPAARRDPEPKRARSRQVSPSRPGGAGVGAQARLVGPFEG
jgi:hypothetical protein